MSSAGEALPVVPGFLERLTDPERWLPAAVEVLVWFSVPTIMVLVMAGIGFLVVRGGNSPSTVVHAAVAGALLLIAAVTAANFFIRLPRLTSVVVAVIGLALFARETRRRGVARTDLMNLIGALAGGSALYRLRMGSTVGYDTFLYHGPVVEWLAREPLPQGLALLHSRFGFSNGLLLLMGAFRSPLGDWSHHALVEAAIVALGFAALAVCFSAARQRQDPWTASFAAASFIVGAVYLALASHEPGNDLAVAFTLLAAMAFASFVARERASTDSEALSLLVMLIVFAIVQKSSALSALVLLGYGLGARSRRSDVLALVRSVRRGILFASGVLALVTARTMIATGCLAFPLGPTCLDAAWATGREAAAAESRGIRSWARNWGSGPATTTWDMTWVPDWASLYITTVQVRVVLVSAFIGVMVMLLRGSESTIGGPPTAITTYLVIGGALWFIGAPDPRFALHLHLAVAAILLVPAAAWALGTTASRVAQPRMPVRASTALLLVALAIVSGRLVYSGRTLPFASSTTADASEPLVTLTLPTRDENSSWEYFVRAGSDQCGAAFPCAPGELPSDLLIDPTGRRLRFELAGD
jgi:hypothetical protein